MKTMPLNHGLTLDRLLKEAAHDRVVLTDDEGRALFSVTPAQGAEADFETEAETLGTSPELIQDLERWRAEGHQGRSKTLEQVRAEYEALAQIPPLLASLSDVEADEILKKLAINPRDHGMGSARALIDHWRRCVEGLASEGF